MLLDKKKFIVTGGSGGIGQKIVSTLLENGAAVAVVARSKNKLKELQNKFGRNKLFVVSADVSCWPQVDSVFSQIINEFRRIDGMINAAAINEPIKPFIETPIKEWVNAINIDLLGAVYCCKRILPHLAEKGDGKIINFSGGGATSSFPCFSAYATAKTGIVRFTEIIAEEVKPYGVYVNAVAPGAINTVMLDNMLKAGPKILGSEQYAKVLKQKQNGGDDVNLICELVLFLLSNNSFDLTGKLISAKWDNWKKWGKTEIERLSSCSEYTLRRIDNKYFQEIKK